MTSVLLIGTGRMARAYAQVLTALNVPAIAVGRSEEHARTFERETGMKALSGGLSNWKKTAHEIPTHAIIAADVEAIPAIARELIDSCIKHLLLEKPAALEKVELMPLQTHAKNNGASVSVGYNRRFLSSAQKAKELIAADGGAISFYFEFNERTTQPERIKGMNTPKRTVERWFIANSTHVIDLAFYLAGEPLALSGFAAAGPLWAPHPTLFSGAGLARNNVVFSYYANWEIDGPWLVEVQTSRRKLVLNPLEKLHEEKDGVLELVSYDDSLDTAWRPGLYREVECFLSGTGDSPTLEEQVLRFDWYEKMLS